MPEQLPLSEQRLLALARYISALEQGEIDPLIEVLQQAEHDPLLAQLLQEVHALYQEDENLTVAEAEMPATLRLVAVSESQNGQSTPDRQPINLHEIRFQRGNKEIVMEERTSVMPLESKDQPPAPPRQHRRGFWLSLMAAILIVGLLLASTPLVLHLRGQASSGRVPAHPVQPTPTVTGTPQSSQNTNALASQYVSHLSLDDEIGQLLLVQFNESAYSGDIAAMIGQLHVGGVILYSLQLKSVQQAKSLIDQLQQHSSTPPLISIDEEGCPYIDRLQSLYGCHMNASQIGSSGDIKIARQQGLEVSQDLTSLGINTNLAPDVDVSRQDNPALLDRTFGNTSAEVIKYAGAYLQALQGNGTIGCLKHFPGLGAASTDPHTALAVANISKDQLYKTDLAPFKAFIQASDPLLNPGMIMATDELVPAIDPTYPANLSHTFITDILRNELHYNGVVLSDALYMEGISQKWSLAQATVMALQAGDDLLLGASDFTQASSMIHAIKQAVQSGQLSKARIDEAATRVIALKMQYHLMPANA